MYEDPKYHDIMARALIYFDLIHQERKKVKGKTTENGENEEESNIERS